jgi:predicted nuclease with TOPRIM domain
VCYNRTKLQGQLFLLSKGKVNMDQIDTSSVAGIFVTAILAVLALALGLQKLLKTWKVTDVESSIITLMHSELERMSSQNTLLASELNKLQLEILNLNKELNNLTLDNQRLHTEVVSLTREVSRLQTSLTGV